METISSQGVYLGAARMALNYVQSKMDIGASNKLSNMHHFGVVQACVAESRSRIFEDLKGQAPALNATGGDKDKARVDTFATWAAHYGCGNCGEQSAMAFVQLRDVSHVRPLDWMQIDSFSHAFVVIGRLSVTRASDVATWNSEAVVCDPWEGYSGPASTFAKLRGRLIGPLYRLE
jgi:hypothetical protein